MMLVAICSAEEAGRPPALEMRADRRLQRRKIALELTLSRIHEEQRVEIAAHRVAMIEALEKPQHLRGSGPLARLSRREGFPAPHCGPARR